MAPILSPTVDSRAAADAIARVSGRDHHDAALVLGSGWSEVVTALADPGTAVTVPVADLPGFVAPSAAGHRGTVTSCLVDGVPLLCIAGRTHLYEGLGTEPVVHPAHVAAAAGARVLVLTNAAGGLRADLAVGDIVLICDHLNLTGRSPLTGAMFVDLVDAYPARLRAVASDALAAVSRSRPAEGVYAAMPGPQYETPAEIRMLRTLGADLVGMSTVPEVVTARALGLDVVAASLVTNLAAGVTGDPLDHAEVLAAGSAGVDELTVALRAVIPAVGRG